MATQDQHTDQAKQAAGWVTGLLTGWGIPGSVARILAGAIIGAVAAYVTLTQSGCTADFRQTADGVDFSGTLVFPIDNTINK